MTARVVRLDELPLQRVRAHEGEGEILFYLDAAPGMGKSHLLQAACRTAGKAGRTAAYLPLGELLDMPPGILEGLDEIQLVWYKDLV